MSRRRAGAGSRSGRRGLSSSLAVARPTRCRIASTAARSRAISANGLSLRRLRSRSSRTAASFRGSQARWNPPRPRMARIRPSASRLRASAIGADNCGPHCGLGRAPVERDQPPERAFEVGRVEPVERHGRDRGLGQDLAGQAQQQRGVGRVLEHVGDGQVADRGGGEHRAVGLLGPQVAQARSRSPRRRRCRRPGPWPARRRCRRAPRSGTWPGSRAARRRGRSRRRRS